MQNHEKRKKRPTYFTIKEKNILWFIPTKDKKFVINTLNEYITLLRDIVAKNIDVKSNDVGLVLKK